MPQTAIDNRLISWHYQNWVWSNNGNIKELQKILKCSIVESKTIYMLEREEENDKGNIGSRATLPIGKCG
jgi:hypothetical protein